MSTPRRKSRGEILSSGQLAMFMTPREIHASYQPLDADREGRETQKDVGSSGPPSGAGGWRYQPGAWTGHPSVSGFYQDAGGTKYRDRPETDDELWARKLDESQMGPMEYADMRGENLRPPDIHWSRSSAPRMPTGMPGTTTWQKHYDAEESYVVRKERSWEDKVAYGPSIHESVRESGVHSPITLGLHGYSRGSTGKPEILGGHHRLAAQTDIDPDRLVPVTHDYSIFHAKLRGDYT